MLVRGTIRRKAIDENKEVKVIMEVVIVI